MNTCGYRIWEVKEFEFELIKTILQVHKVTRKIIYMYNKYSYNKKK